MLHGRMPQIRPPGTAYPSSTPTPIPTSPPPPPTTTTPPPPPPPPPTPNHHRHHHHHHHHHYYITIHLLILIHLLRRRLNSDVSLTALFNTIGEEEWICESVESPELPNLYAANVTLITDCIDETGKDICTLVWGAGGPLVDVPGVVTAENGQRFLHKKRYLWQNGSDTVIMDYPSFSPFMITATIAMKGQGFMNFQFNQLNEHVTQCMESDLDLKLRLPDDYHFYYVETDPATDIRMFRISYEVESYNGEKIIEEDGTTIWSHIEYYDHKDTKMPVKLVFQDGKGTLVYDELVMEPALIPRYDDLAVTQIQQV